MEAQYRLDLHLKDHMKVDIGNQSQHYAGTAFDVGQTLSDTRRRQLWNSARNSGVWSYVEPISVTPTWVHFDKRFRESSMFYWRISAFKERKFE